jgi:hypothetical protein
MNILDVQDRDPVAWVVRRLHVSAFVVADRENFQVGPIGLRRHAHAVIQKQLHKPIRLSANAGGTDNATNVSTEPVARMRVRLAVAAVARLEPVLAQKLDDAADAMIDLVHRVSMALIARASTGAA